MVYLDQVFVTLDIAADKLLNIFFRVFRLEHNTYVEMFRYYVFCLTLFGLMSFLSNDVLSNDVWSKIVIL
jgi:hypothetical protein